jgi:hypothetical protein
MHMNSQVSSNSNSSFAPSSYSREAGYHRRDRIDPVLDVKFLNGDFSLRELSLQVGFTDLPKKNLANLRDIKLKIFSRPYGTTQILDFLESAALLDTVSLLYPIEGSSSAHLSEELTYAPKDFHYRGRATASDPLTPSPYSHRGITDLGVLLRW